MEKNERHSPIVFITNLYVFGGIFLFCTGIRIWGDANRVRGNLVALSVWPGTYQNRKDLSSTLWHAAIEVV